MKRALFLISITLSGCVADRAGNPSFGCDDNTDCGDGGTCYQGFCIATVCEQCYEAQEGTPGVGVCTFGCWGTSSEGGRRSDRAG